jgi:RNA-binding protein YhbY
MKNQQWELKYKDLKLKFHDAVDVAFRLGYEAGAQGAQLQQMQQAQAASVGGMPGQDELSGNSGGLDSQSNGSELDQHIGTLESMLQNSKPGSPEQSQLQKSLDGIKAYQNNIRQKYELHKSELAIKSIAKSMEPKFTIGKAATKNLSSTATKALNMQEQIVADLMKSMEDEEKKTAEAITKTLNLEQLLKE